jgi:hypothetical protein
VIDRCIRRVDGQRTGSIHNQPRARRARRDLIREEIALAKAEARVELAKATSAAAQFGAAAVAGWFAAMFILAAVALGISYAFSWPDWAGFAIVGVGLGVIGGVLFVMARGAARRVEPMPRTVEAVKENFR